MASVTVRLLAIFTTPNQAGRIRIGKANRRNSRNWCGVDKRVIKSSTAKRSGSGVSKEGRSKGDSWKGANSWNWWDRYAEWLGGCLIPNTQQISSWWYPTGKLKNVSLCPCPNTASDFRWPFSSVRTRYHLRPQSLWSLVNTPPVKIILLLVMIFLRE